MLHFCCADNIMAMVHHGVSIFAKVQQHQSRSTTCGGIHSEKKKRQKKSMFIYGTTLRKTNLAEIFSEARSGTIAHKNKKRITAVTHY
jgi:predicted nucleic acid-binding Zn ribbon protein